MLDDGEIYECESAVIPSVSVFRHNGTVLKQRNRFIIPLRRRQDHIGNADAWAFHRQTPYRDLIVGIHLLLTSAVIVVSIRGTAVNCA